MLALAALGCQSQAPQAGGGTPDGGTPVGDAARPADASSRPVDAASRPPDAAPTPIDAARPPVDARTDAALPPVDAATRFDAPPMADAPPGGTPTVVAATQIHQDWGVGSWSQSTISVTGVQAGDAIIVLGIYWDSASPSEVNGPSDSMGHLSVAVDQGPTYVVGGTLPVIAQIYYQLGSAAGTHVITPPGLGGGDGDGTLYVIHVRGLPPSASLVGTGLSHALGTALPSVAVKLTGSALPGDFVVAVGGEDNQVGFADAQVTHAPSAWQPIGVQDDGTNNVPSEASYRLAPSSGDQSVSWTWADPTANVTTAAIAAFR